MDQWQNIGVTWLKCVESNVKTGICRTPYFNVMMLSIYDHISALISPMQHDLFIMTIVYDFN